MSGIGAGDSTVTSTPNRFGGANPRREQDDSLLWWDQQRLIEITREVGCRDTLRYEHRRAREELLLAIPDAIAWCWARGETWRRRVEPVVSKRQSV